MTAFILRVPASARHALRPGHVLRALATSGVAPSESVSVLRPRGDGDLDVIIAPATAHRILTPTPLPCVVAGMPTTAHLTRSDDIALPAPGEAVVRWDDGGTAPSPGAVSKAIVDAVPASSGQLGAIWPAADHLRLTVPPQTVAALGASTPLKIAGRAMTLTVGA